MPALQGTGTGLAHPSPKPSQGQANSSSGSDAEQNQTRSLSSKALPELSLALQGTPFPSCTEGQSAGSHKSGLCLEQSSNPLYNVVPKPQLERMILRQSLRRAHHPL